MADPSRICVVTSYTAAAEPRGPRHAIAAKKAFPNAMVIFVDMAASGVPPQPEPQLLLGQGIKRCTANFPSRASGVMRLAARKLMTQLGHAAFSRFGILKESVFGERAQGLTRVLVDQAADVYIAHNIETLLPAMAAAESRGAKVVFDCMEFYSDMGDSQHPTEAAAARAVEARYLGRCALVIASSDLMADALALEYGIMRPLAAYNVPPTEKELPKRKGGGLNLYWRNSTIGFGQRGLADALDALVVLPTDVHLYLQGRKTPASTAELAARISTLELRERVHFLPPYLPHQAVREAAFYDVGLCLERAGPRNHDLTVSNKMFDYHMAGLAVIATNIPALADVIRRSEGGLVCEPNAPESLADAIRRLKLSPLLLRKLQQKARQFALDRGNIETEIDKISAELRRVLCAAT